MKVAYNAPFTLTFCLLCVIAFIITALTDGWAADKIFSVSPAMSSTSPMTWLRLITHSIGHASIPHLSYNLMIILLIGPLLEEKHGTTRMAIVAVVTAFVTGLAAWLLTPNGLLGASGICFALIVLGSIARGQRGTLPLTFLLVVFIFLGNEIMQSLKNDNISQLAHLLGGITGGIFGFIYRD